VGAWDTASYGAGTPGEAMKSPKEYAVKIELPLKMILIITSGK
jgi:hypothetical protein